MGIAYNPSVVTDGLVLYFDAANPKSYTGVTTSVTVITGAEPYADNVSLLLNGNGDNNSTTFTDSSSYGHTVTPVGGAKISTTQNKFGGASMYFDGSGDYLTASDSSFIWYENSQLTIELWMRASSTATGEALLSGGNNGDDESWELRGGTNLEFFTGYSGSLLSATFPSLNTWHHVAITRDSTSIYRMYINGTEVNSTFTDEEGDYDNGTLRIGTNRAANSYYHGYLDDVRITIGVARYTSNFFTPPAAELSLSTTETQQAPVLTDISPNNNTAILYNGVGHTSSNVGYFTFDGTNDYGIINDVTGVTDFSITDNYTVDFWIYLNSTQNNTQNGNNDVVEKWSGAGGYPFTFRYVRATQIMSVSVYNGSSSNSTSIQISHSNWWNITGVFNWSSSLLTLYGNGGSVAASTTLNLTGTITNDSALNLMRGGNGINYATGNLSNLKIYNRALTPQEIQQNYNAHKSRYGL
jgi:hypothetical protein